MKRYLFTLMLWSVSLCGWAVPALPGLHTLRQPDGTEVSVYLFGDERHHYYLSETGYLVAPSEGYFYYADADDEGRVTLSGFRLDMPASADLTRGTSYSPEEVEKLERYLGSIDKSGITAKMDAARRRTARYKSPYPGSTRSEVSPAGGPGLYPYATYPVTGQQRTLVILVEFADVPMVLDRPRDYFTRMLNEPDFSDYKATGSVRDYFLHCSDNQFSPEFDVYGPVKLLYPRAYYGANDSDGNDQHPAHMVADACAALDSEIDFRQYDLDGDGEIDNVFIFYAGEGEAAGGGDDTIWPHSWYVTEGMTKKQIFDGVLLNRYACSCEWMMVNNKVGRPDGVGTFIHEFSHVMGLPDLYPTDYSPAFTPEKWSVMDGGSYNNNSRTPPQYSAYERYALGWLQPFDLTAINGPVALNPIGSNEAGIIVTRDETGEQTPNEYFLVENRQLTGWDRYLPGHGMVVWHIDYDERVWWNNEVNNKPGHQHVDLVEADGSTFANKDRRGDTFPGHKNVTSFGDDTSPSTRSWKKVPSGVSLTDISENDGMITFNLQNSADVPMIGLDSSAGTAFSWKIEGDSLCLSGLVPSTQVTLYDLTGRVVSHGQADGSGELTLALPHKGIYLVRTIYKTVKITVS